MLAVLLLASGMLARTPDAFAACSTYAKKAYFNEYYFGNGTNFLEVHIKNVNQVPVADWQGWTLRVFTSPSAFTDYVLTSASATYCEFGSKAYITFEVPGGLPDPDLSVALLDASGNEIDYLDACGPPGSCTLPGFYTPEPAVCSNADHDLQISSMGNRDFGRFPDGTGSWANSSGTGAGTSTSSCEINTEGITKVADNASVSVGNNVSFTIEGINNGNKAEDFTITDDIPAGFTYVSATPSQGTVDTSSLPQLVWNAGSVAKNGGQVSLVVTVSGDTPGSYDNIATLVAPCSDPANCPIDTANVQVVAAPTADHVAISHDTTAVTCQAEPVTVSVHQNDHSIDTGYTGTLILTTTTGNGDWTLLGGSGTLDNGAADDGTATYSMDAADNGVVLLGLKNTHVETVNINAGDGTISENTGTALASEDQNLLFAESGFVFLGGGVIDNIGTQIAGKPSATAPGAQVIEMQAVRTNDSTGACEAALTGVNAVDMAFECRNPSSCSAALVNINGGASTNIPGNPLGSVSSYTPVSLDFGDATDTTANFIVTYADAGEIRLYSRYSIPLPNGNPSGNFMFGGSNAFVVRPFGFDIDFSGDRAANGNSGVSWAADENGSAFQLAGADFDATLTAVAWSSADDADNDGVPDTCTDLTNNLVTGNFGNEAAAVTPADVSLSSSLVAPAGGAPGTLSTVASGAGFTAGAGGKTIHWSEVGIIDINASLADYLGSGQNVAGNVCNVGRFYPQDFVIANANVTDRSDIVGCTDPFTYMDENFTIGFDLEAWNAATPAEITQNYEGAFAMLDTTVLGDMNYGATDSATDLTARLSVSSAGAFAAGVAPVTATLSLGRDPTPDGAWTAFEVGIAPADSDGVSLAALDLSLDGGPDTHGLIGQTEIRYGRLNLANNFGSELLPLTLPLSAEYYSDATTGYVLNTDDNCTSVATADVLLFNDQEPKQGRVLGNATISVSGAANTTLTGVSAFTGGQSALSFTAPGAEGYVDVEVQTPAWLLSDLDGIDHGIQGPGMHCVPGLAATDPAFIPACVADGDAVDDIPTARGNFGIFRGSDNIIYIREMY